MAARLFRHVISQRVFTHTQIANSSTYIVAKDTATQRDVDRTLLESTRKIAYVKRATLHAKRFIYCQRAVYLAKVVRVEALTNEPHLMHTHRAMSCGKVGKHSKHLHNGHESCTHKNRHTPIPIQSK